MDRKQLMVREFHKKMKITVNDFPVLIAPSVEKQRLKIISEELRELKEAMRIGNVVRVADALADLEYAVLGTAIVYGIDLEPIFSEIHRSNMTKDSPKIPDGKAIKGVRYSKADVFGVLIKQFE